MVKVGLGFDFLLGFIPGNLLRPGSYNFAGRLETRKIQFAGESAHRCEENKAESQFEVSSPIFQISVGNLSTHPQFLGLFELAGVYRGL